MTTNLKQYFPLVWEREELKKEIQENSRLLQRFEQWNENQREYFLDCCTGMKGVKVLYDAFFKEIMNPEVTPERLEEFLTLLMNKKVKILHVLTNDGPRIADENCILIMDIVVELEDGSIVNVEVQKIGHNFPGERSACYSSDLLLRQYRRVRGEKGKQFHYRDMKDVYTIVFFERSMEAFHQFPEQYLHYFEQTSNTGVKLNLLQKYLFIPLDIFRKSLQDKTIETKLEAWLAFLSLDDPEMIIHLLEQYPEFKPMYEQVYEICRNVDGVMTMFSKELLEMDKNLVQSVMEELQEEVDRKKAELEEMNHKILEMNHEVLKMNHKVSEMSTQLVEKVSELAEKESELEEKKNEMAEKEDELTVKDKELMEKKCELAEKEGKLAENEDKLAKKEQELQSIMAQNQRLKEELAAYQMQ